VRAGAVGALVSRLPAGEYERERVEPRLGDVAWMGGRAVAHDAVVTWASERGGVIPVPMFTLFSDDAAVAAMLRDREPELSETIARVAPGEEYGVRLFRLDELLERHVAEASPALARLEARARAAPPGQRYLLERKIEGERAAEVRRVGAAAARELFEGLQPHALDAVRDSVPRAAGEGSAGVAVLDGFFLVRRGALEPFRGALAELAGRWEPLGFRVEFTGPWPPYHFVRRSA
jgi:hypothetical protein